MSRSTISTFQLFQKFPDVETARKYLESKLWPNGATCPKCHKTFGIITRTRVGFFRCPACTLDFLIQHQAQFLNAHTFLCTSGFTRCTCF